VAEAKRSNAGRGGGLLADIAVPLKSGQLQGYTLQPRFVKTPLIDCEEDRTLRAVLVGILREHDR
jgi:hypothetical protein